MRPHATTVAADTTWHNSPTGIPMNLAITGQLFTGASPELGACEYGMANWKAGHDRGKPDWEYSLKDDYASVALAVPPSAFHPRLVVKQHAVVITAEQWHLTIFDAVGRIVRTVQISRRERATARIPLADFSRVCIRRI